jgi:DNA-binding SARP family transcriptional activator
MDVPEMLEVVAQALSALLAVWLGLTVATRSSLPVARVFTFLALVLATWSSSIILQRLTTPPDSAVAAAGRSIEDIAAALAIGGLAHFALAIATDGHPSRRQLAVVGAIYASLVAFALPTILHFEPSIALTPPHFSLGPIPGALLFWGWVAARLVAIALGAGWLLRAMRARDAGPLRRRQLRAALATIAMAGLGASLRFLPVIGDADRWIGTSFITLAVVCASYAVFAAGIFFGPAVAARAFRTSVLGGAVVGALIALLLGIEVLSSTLLGLESPFFPVLGLVVIAALYGPLGPRVRGRVIGGGSRAVARDRLLRALGERELAASPASEGVQPALARVIRVLDVTGLTVSAPDGSLIASEGAPPAPGSVVPISLMEGGELVGEMRVGETATGAPLDTRDLRLLELSASYVASAVRTGRREDEQATELARLAEARAVVDSHAEALHTALVEHSDAAPGVRIFALGPLRVEREGARIEHWGGDKAGSRQAQGMFAFLYDRGERGVAKDEVLELIWPDIDLERADLAFHRTMGGLRSTLDPDHRRGERSAVRFANDRYRLADPVVAWSDVDAFLGALDAAAADPADRIRLLEAARHLYRGEYLDDCPYYGDSAFVEHRRAHLRDRFVDLAVTLGEAYESGGDRMSAAAAFREAVMRAPEGCPPAVAGLARLGL